MLKTALQPRWLGLLGLVTVLVAVFTVLGMWQLNVAKDEGRQEALNQAASLTPVPLESLLQPHVHFPGDLSNRPITVTGRYGAGRQIVVEGRRLGTASGVWVVTPLTVSSTGATVAVLRGFAADTTTNGTGTGIPPLSTDEVTVAGTLGPGESPSGERVTLPAGRYETLDLSRLVNTWPGDMYDAIVFAKSESPNATSGLERVPPPELPTAMTPRNLAYAFQWWIFALFAIWMWWRMVREDHRTTTAPLAPDPIGAGTP